MIALIRNFTSEIESISLAILVIIAPFLIFPSSLSLWVSLSMPFLWILRYRAKQNILENTIIDWPIFLLTVWILAFCLTTADQAFSLSKILNLVYGIFFYYTALSIMKYEKAIKRGITIFLGMGMTVALFGFLGMNWSTESILYELLYKLEKHIPNISWRLPGAEGGINPNALAGTLLFILPGCIIFLGSRVSRNIPSSSRSRRPKEIALLIFITSIIIIIVLFTQAFLCLIAAILSIWIVGLNRKWKIISVFMIMTLFVLLSLVKYNDSTSWAQRIFAKVVQEKLGPRFIFWPSGLAAIEEHPLIGIGMNRIRLLPEIGYDNAHVHNHFINLAAEMGVPALVGYLALLMGAGYICYAVWKTSKIPWIRVVIRGLAAGQLAHVFFGLGDSIPLGAKPGLFFWFSLALITALYNWTLKNPNEDPIPSQRMAINQR